MSADPLAMRADGRRHDLDALRAFAMLLGIALHASLSFFPVPWPVQDSRQSELFGLFFAGVHGFRMPLFFVVSGFFTMMIYRKRGLGPLLRQRAARILLPCMLGLITVVPLMHWVSGRALRTGGRPVTGAEETLGDAIRSGNREAIERFVQGGEAIDGPDSKLGITPLSWAAMKGDVASVTLLIEHGADVNRGNRDGSTPLHSAAFLGHDPVAEILIEHGADATLRNQRNERAIEVTYADWGVTTFITNLIGLPKLEKDRVEEGRGRVRERLAKLAGPAEDRFARSGESAVLGAYRRFVNSDRFTLRFGEWQFNLIRTNVFDHLWFLWFLCWMVGAFSLVAWGGPRLGLGGRLARRLPVVSGARVLWLLPLTLVPQWFMGLDAPSFGPDTSTGLIPMPHVLAYYLVFFGFGALYFDARDDGGRLGRFWWLWLPLCLAVAFPAGLVTIPFRPVTSVVQVLYVWGMSFGMIGLFRAALGRERPAIRYLSDASYWLYLAHLPLVIALQMAVRDQPWGAFPKFLLVNLAATIPLLVVYQLLVRNTWIGVMLNGRRARAAADGGEAALFPVPAEHQVHNQA
jgi:peptidoglycan/LPS O-acetylase OafA/YrhL